MRGCAGSGMCWPREAGWGTPAPASQGENTNPFIFILLLIHLGCTGLMETRWRKTDTALSSWDKLPQRKKEKKKEKNNSSRVGVMLGNYCLEAVLGGCPVPPKIPFTHHGARPILQISWVGARILWASWALFVLGVSGPGY